MADRHASCVTLNISCFGVVMRWTLARMIMGSMGSSLTARQAMARAMGRWPTARFGPACLTVPAWKRSLSTASPFFHPSARTLWSLRAGGTLHRQLHATLCPSQQRPPSPKRPLPPPRRSSRHIRRLRNLLFLFVLLTICYYTVSPFRHTVIAGIRCARLMKAVTLDVLDYQSTFKNEALLSDSEQDLLKKRQARKECHRRSAERMLEALKKNSGIYVKLGQHVAAVQVLPKEWTQTMTPLQDQCLPTPVEDIDAMLKHDMGRGIDELFTDFDPNPIGVASLAQVHRAVDRQTGRPVAVKVQHADLADYVKIDMATTNFAIHLVKYIFPDFEFSWLGDEMNEMLPLELDFEHEAANSARAANEFAPLKGKTSVYFPQVIWADKRCLVMEYIEGRRIDDLVFLKDHNIDRNQVSQELSRIFSQMVYINGHFHADPHHGNLLIRPRAPGSSSPFNFDVCLLDHGQYFDLDDELRVNYAKFWLSLIKRSSDATSAERRKYARLVGNIGDDMYPILESAITGRVNIEDAAKDQNDGRPSSLLDQAKMDDAELSKLRRAAMEREGLITEIFELLRRVPRRMVMILKLADLQRALDYSLSTTHGPSRVFLIVAQYCAKAVWQDDRRRLSDQFRQQGLSLGLLTSFLSSFGSFLYWNVGLGIVERGLDIRARVVKYNLYLHGLVTGGFDKATKEMAGLAV